MTINDLRAIAATHGNAPNEVLILEQPSTLSAWVLVPNPTFELQRDIDHRRPAYVRIQVVGHDSLSEIVDGLAADAYAEGLAAGSVRWWHRFAWWL